MGEMVVLKSEMTPFREVGLMRELVGLNCVPVVLLARNNHVMSIIAR